ncbi:UNVERIFIED_CONTAM: hypothetical protein HDU68_000252 [Siphonaria sp. JEL0065]|nr:hypothetical protein HDU68_000252 [Siphonaria sp. JEL0065]
MPGTTHATPTLSCPSKIATTPPPLTDDQLQSITTVYAQMPALIESICEGLDTTATLSEWANEGTCRRFLNATNYNEQAALTRLKTTLLWRKEYKPDEIPAEEVEPEATTGKLFLNGFDKQGRPLLFGIPRLDTNHTYDRYLRFCVFMTEKTISVMPENQEKLALMMDNEGLGMFNGPPLSFLTRFIGIMDTHYPGRLGICMLINPNWMVSTIYRLISPFLDDVVKAKVYFANAQKAGGGGAGGKSGVAKISPVSGKAEKSSEFKELGGWTTLLEHIDADQLMVKYGGSRLFDIVKIKKNMLKVQNGIAVNTNPLFVSTVNRPAKIALTPNQDQAVTDLLSQVPSLINELEGDVTPKDRQDLTEWADEACVRRYLVATKWDLKSAATRLIATMNWRNEYRPHEIDPKEIEPEAVTGRSYISGFAKGGSPILFLVPREERAKDTTLERGLKFSVFMLERAIKLMPPGVEKLGLFIDYEGVTRANATPMSQSLKYLSIFGSHYPERLGIGVMINPSWYLPVLLTCLGPFMDPVTKSKIHFVNLKDTSRVAGTNNGTGGWVNILDCVEADQLPTQYGGSFEFQYSHDVYWPKLLAL